MFSLGNQGHTHNLADAYKYSCPKCHLPFYSADEGKCHRCKNYLKIVDGVPVITKPPKKVANKPKAPKQKIIQCITNITIIKVR